MLWSALVLGILGSGHCIFMCGPLSLLLPNSSKINFTFLKSRILYHLGRIFTYSLLGFVIGWASQKSLIFVSQKYLSISAGILLMAIVFSSIFLKAKTKSFINISKLRNLPFLKSSLGFGIINGLLPCGLTYTALGAAFLTLSPWSGAFYMLVFGLGTFPLLLITSMGISKFQIPTFRRYLPIAYTFIACWLIYRGMSNTPTLYGNTEKDVVICTTP